MTQPSSVNSSAPSIPGYTILGLAGRGGMGAVYKAEQAAPRRTVALKVLSRATPAALADFRREAQTVAALEHPHIVPLYAFGEHEGAPFLTLRYLDGGTVADRLRTGPIDLPTAARWIAAIAEALHFAHGRGIVHRDLKPSNILLDRSGNAYLADFGIAAATASAAGGPATGSAAYMPPEQGRGEPVDARGDLYSLAVTLFEMLTGAKPYTAETAFGMVVRHVNDPIPSARALNPAIPPAVDELIQWTMAKQADERPQTAHEFAARLKQALAHPAAPIRPAAPSVVVSPTIAVAAPPPANRSLVWIGLAAVLLIVCAVGSVIALASGVAALSFLATPTLPPTATRLPATAAPNTPAPPPTPTLDPDGGIVVDGDTTRIIVLTSGIEWMRPLEAGSLSDVAIEAVARQQSGPAKNEIALLCRFRDSANHVAFAISGDGTYSVWLKRGGDTARLVDWAGSAAIAAGPGAQNRLRAVCSGSALRFEVNGQLLAEAEDPAPAAGDAALMAGLREPGELVVEFSAVGLSAP